jgi:hypothetical protein
MQTCYLTYRLSSTCFVLNSTHQVEEEGCLDGAKTKDQLLRWTQPSPPTQMKQSVSLTVRSAFDPYVVAYHQDLLDLSPSSTKLSVLGLIFVIISGALFLLPGAFCIAKCRRKHKPLMEMEMDGSIAHRI